MRFLMRIYILVIVVLVGHGETLTLNGPWTAKIENFVPHFEGLIPGGIYTDLLNANLISDTLKGANDVNNRWIGNRSVTYTRQFQVNSTILKAPKILLIFDGLDTFATISVNDHEIGRTSNMFLRHVFDVKNHLEIGANVVNVTFRSALLEAKNLYEKQSASYKVPPECVPAQYNGECHVNHIRKMQASFSWDWGPAIPSMGIWKNVEVVPVYDAVIIESAVDVIPLTRTWKLNASFIFGVGSHIPNNVLIGILSLRLEINANRSLASSKQIFMDTDEAYVRDAISLDVPKNDVQRWWPNGYGEQKLYNLWLVLETPVGLVKVKKRIGFRQVELIQSEVVKGRTFYFRVNNVNIFAKGSNWIPASLYPELSSDESVLRHLLSSSRDVHMNMLRVWGGGYYESDIFYDLADEYGIMIWQDFMFACAMYPTSVEFLDSVREEIRQNVQRLKHHPSIVLWAGNNENEAALYGNWYGTGKAEIYQKDYIKLYVETIKREVDKLDSTKPFVVSSPSDGSWTEENGFFGPDPYSKFYGDVHYYNYWSNGWDINQYPKVRFASEYGFQSIPSMETLKTATDEPNDLRYNSSFLKHRQHLPGGWSFMKLMISKNLRIPRSNDSYRDLEDYVYLSQLNQAISTKIETESYRQLRSSFTELGEGYTMGALYWQLNDVWQAPSWSSIDFAGRWKMLHYFARDFFAPVIVSPRLHYSNDVTIYIVSDELSPIPGCQLDVNVYKWNSSQPEIRRSFFNVTIASNDALIVATFWLYELLKMASCGAGAAAYKNCFVELVLRNKTGQQIAPTNYIYPAPLKDIVLPNPVIAVSNDPKPIPGKLSNYLDYQFELSSDGVALFVWLEFPHKAGRFSENGFHLIGKKTITFHTKESIVAKELSDGLKITTLAHLYNADRSF